MKNKIVCATAITLSVAFILTEIWNGFTRSLGSYYDPDQTRQNAIVGSLIVAAVLSLILFALIYALSKGKLFADIGWIVVAPILFMLIWDTITKNLVERGLIASGWLTDSAYLSEPGTRLHRIAWIFTGLLIALPFVYNLYADYSQKKSIKKQ